MRLDGPSNFGPAHFATPPVAHPAPAIDKNGRGIWSVWVGDGLDPVASFYSYAACMQSADVLAASGVRVFTDAI